MDNLDCCWRAGDCVGSGDEAIRRPNATWADGDHAHCNVGQRLVAVVIDEVAAAWDRLPLWTGIGAFRTFIVGISVLDEQATAGRILAAVLIVAGLVLVNASSE